MSYKLEMHQVNTVPLARQFDREQGHSKVTLQEAKDLIGNLVGLLFALTRMDCR